MNAPWAAFESHTSVTTQPPSDAPAEWLCRPAGQSPPPVRGSKLSLAFTES